MTKEDAILTWVAAVGRGEVEAVVDYKLKCDIGIGVINALDEIGLMVVPKLTLCNERLDALWEGKIGTK